MRTTTMSMATGRSLRDVALVGHQKRRLVGVERSYSCGSCGGQHRSWTRLSACPSCGERLAVAVIRRAAFA